MTNIYQYNINGVSCIFPMVGKLALTPVETDDGLISIQRQIEGDYIYMPTIKEKDIASIFSLLEQRAFDDGLKLDRSSRIIVLNELGERGYALFIR